MTPSELPELDTNWISTERVYTIESVHAREQAIVKRLKTNLEFLSRALKELDGRFPTGAEVPIELRVLHHRIEKLIQEMEKVK